MQVIYRNSLPREERDEQYDLLRDKYRDNAREDLVYAKEHGTLIIFRHRKLFYADFSAGMKVRTYIICRFTGLNEMLNIIPAYFPQFISAAEFERECREIGWIW